MVQITKVTNLGCKTDGLRNSESKRNSEIEGRNSESKRNSKTHNDLEPLRGRVFKSQNRNQNLKN